MDAGTPTPTEGVEMFSSVSASPASEKGAVDGFAAQCTCCGMVVKSSMKSAMQFEMAAHAAWHARSK